MRSGELYRRVMTAVMAAVLAAVSPFVLPVGPVPVSLSTFVIFLLACVLGRRALWAVLVYVLLGAVGMPVFAGFAGGAGVLFGPTGGYIVGYLPLAWLSGWGAERLRGRPALLAVCFAAATAVLYALGTAWYCVQTQMAPAAALALCVLPFLPGDLAKLAAAAAAGPVLRRRLEQAELI